MVLGREEGAEMMIEPPGDCGRWRVFEINDGVFIAGKFLLIEQRAGAMDESAEFVFRRRRDAFAVEACKQRGGTCAVKTFVVIKNAYLHLGADTPFKTFFCWAETTSIAGSGRCVKRSACVWLRETAGGRQVFSER